MQKKIHLSANTQKNKIKSLSSACLTFFNKNNQKIKKLITLSSKSKKITKKDRKAKKKRMAEESRIEVRFGEPFEGDGHLNFKVNLVINSE